MLNTLLPGFKVLDLSQYIPGPYATLLLSDMGADVIKVEPPQGDPMRTFGPVADDGLSPLYRVLNGNKTIVHLDLKTVEGKAELERLVQQADALVESFRPGVLPRLGFGPERLQSLNPRLIHCALSGYGQTGPLALQAGHDLTYMALTGALSLMGTEETPVIPFPPIADHAGAMHAVMAILAAAVRQSREGVGVSIDVSLFESALGMNALGLTLGLTGPVLPETDLLNGGAACYRLYRCKDGRFAALAPLEPKFWRAFCLAVERPDWIDRQGEPMPQTALIAEIAALFLTRTLDEWSAVLTPVDCCFDPVLMPAESLRHPHVVDRGYVKTGSAGGGMAEVVFPARVNGLPPVDRRPFRLVGEGAVSTLWR